MILYGVGSSLCVGDLLDPMFIDVNNVSTFHSNGLLFLVSGPPDKRWHITPRA